jgi:phosphoribosylaminoimidazole-succinocarboxamide synthase
MSEAVYETVIPEIKLLNRGKVRDLFELEDALLMVASDRISAFDSVLATTIPDKGRILTQLSIFWFDLLKDLVPNHLITSDPGEMGSDLAGHVKMLAGRSMKVVKAEVFPIECVVRGYLAGSGFKDYTASGKVCGVQLPAGLLNGQKLPQPIFSPSTKAESGHDENISYEEMVKVIGKDSAEKLRDLSLSVYSTAADYAVERGVIIADTKFEFGLFQGQIILIDEVLTPDSSRFWPADQLTPGQPQASFDKQFVRDYLETCGWDKEPPAPELPAEVVAKTREKYLEAYRLLTGKDLQTG